MKFLDVPQSGSFAGVTHSRNRFGQYRRTRAIPVNPNTSAQAVSRTNLADFSAAWRGITQGQRNSWNALADEVTYTNSLGASIHLTGHQLFVKLNKSNQVIGGSILDDPPVQVAFDALGPISFTADVSDSEVNLECSAAVNTGQTFKVFMSPQRSAGRNFEADYRFIKILTFGGITTTANLFAEYVAKFGALVAGMRIFVKVVQCETGWDDSGNVSSTVVTA